MHLILFSNFLSFLITIYAPYPSPPPNHYTVVQGFFLAQSLHALCLLPPPPPHFRKIWILGYCKALVISVLAQSHLRFPSHPLRNLLFSFSVLVPPGFIFPLASIRNRICLLVFLKPLTLLVWVSVISSVLLSAWHTVERHLNTYIY